MHFCCLNHPVCGVFLWQPWHTKTPSPRSHSQILSERSWGTAFRPAADPYTGDHKGWGGKVTKAKKVRPTILIIGRLDVKMSMIFILIYNENLSKFFLRNWYAEFKNSKYNKKGSLCLSCCRVRLLIFLCNLLCRIKSKLSPWFLFLLFWDST